ncbi:redoxin domain-containing protein [Actinomycetes bacterium KLBMP 9797]
MNSYAGSPGLLTRRLGWLLVAAVLAVAGCGGSGPGGDTAGGRPATTAPAAGQLLAFTATTLDGKPFDGMSLAGKPTVLWFWAPWCPVCLGQAPGVRQAVEEYGDAVNIVGVAGLDSVEAMPEFVRLAKVESMTHLADEPGEVWKRFEVTTQSVFVLIDAAGQVTFRGRLDADEVPDRVAALRG